MHQDMDELLAQAVNNPGSLDPAALSAALPVLQQQLADVLKDGSTDEEVEEVRKSFTDMGIDVQELFAALDEMEKAGSDAALGKEGKEFFQTLRKILA